jgi:pullulanase
MLRSTVFWGALRSVRMALGAATVAVLAACGGGGGGGSEPAPVTPQPQPTVDARLASIGDATGHQTVLNALPPAPVAPPASGPSGAATSLTIHYKRLAANDYAGWTMHAFDAAVETQWTDGLKMNVTDSFGAVIDVPLKNTTGRVGYIFHKGDTKDHNNNDQFWTLKPGKNEIWRIEGDATTYETVPGGAGATRPDITTVRVHYRRFDGGYANWGLHLWASNGMDTARVPAGVVIDQWPNPVPFASMPGHAARNGEVVFDIPVLNPKDDVSRGNLEFIIHGMPPNIDNKDGRPDNINVAYAALKPVNQVAEIWLLEGDATVYTSAPDTRLVSTTDARAVWLNKQLVKWPRADGTAAGSVKIYHSATGQITALKDGKVAGADGSITLDRFTGTVPTTTATRFKWVAFGDTFAVKDADLARMATLHKSQLVLVQENAAGDVQNATTAQVAGALDDLYAAAEATTDLGVSITGGITRFKLWAPTAQKVLVFTYDTATGNAVTVDDMVMDGATGVWSATRSGDLSGKYYKYAIDVFVRGTGFTRNLVTDPYSVSLTTDSKRSYIASLSAANLKPTGWDASAIPAKVTANTDMVVYELHVRDFSINDNTVTAANRGKFLAFSEATSNGMKHMKALGDAGVTDVHLLPIFDIASVPETGCTTPAPAGAADAESQQATVTATASTDCFNWGYDPYHFNAPEGSYASDAADGAKRIIELRQMVMGLHSAGLRVGMDVVFNHTAQSGQGAKSVLDRVVPGYYQRLNATGGVSNDGCCDNTATENLMMGKLMIDSTAQWARDYKIASFRFDLMGLQPRAVMEKLKTQVNAAAGRPVQLFGEGWNVGGVTQSGARFAQATQGGMGGTDIGTFGDKMRDAVRGGGCCDGGADIVKRQGFINGIFYDPNAQTDAKELNDLRWLGDLVKGGLAGSINSYSLTTHWDASVTLNNLDGLGYATQPGEVVNYVENHDNLTLFDNNNLKLPLATSKEDRARVQMLGAAVVAFSQGVAYYHAGVDTLRSKSADRNSYDSGDWFNRIDWSYADNYWGMGLPRLEGNDTVTWPLVKPFLANAALKPTAADIAWTRDAFRDLMKIRASTTMLRMRTADDIKSRLTFHNLGSNQVPTVLVGHINGNGYAGATYKELAYFINVGGTSQTLTVAPLAGKSFVLHPVQAAATAADRRVATGANVNTTTGAFTVPARSAVVFVLN